MRNSHENIVLVKVEDIHMPERTVKKLMRRERAEIERMRADFEFDRDVFRVVLRPRFGGGYLVEDGRHRVIAARLAGASMIEALVVGDGDEGN